MRTYNKLSAYDLKDPFAKGDNYKTMDDEQKAFGSSLADRFYYLGSTKVQTPVHTYISNQYSKNNKSTLSTLTDRSAKKYSFGYGRDMVYPLHVDAVLRQREKGNLQPGPGTYQPPELFGNVGSKKSMHARCSYDTVQYRREAKLPGPGDYETEMPIPGPKRKSHLRNSTLLPASQTIPYSYSPRSNNQNPKGQRFNKAQDRFRLNKTLLANPSPIAYSPKLEMGGQQRVFKNNGQAVIGKNNSDILSSTYGLRERS